MHKFGIFIGRFNPFHLGHLNDVRQGLEIAEQLVIVVGSHNQAANIKNPFSSSERIEMIKSCLTDDELKRVHFVKLKDYHYNDALWLVDIQNKVAEITNKSNDIALIGYESDSSSYYLKLFPRWKFYECHSKFQIHATRIRELIFTKDLSFKQYVHENVAKFITNWMNTDEFLRLKDEFEFLNDYKEQWRGAPYPPTFVTVDAIVIKSGHILLVRRGGKHGRNLMALPGGFLEQFEKIETGVIRELKEETRIDVPKELLKKSIVETKVFDHPARSLRGRTIANAYLINLGNGELPKVKGGDDAAKAFWLPLNEVMQREDEFFEDHCHIISYFFNRI